MVEIINIGKCVLCERNNLPITEHHLIPKTLHAGKYVKKRFTSDQMNETIDLCKACHKTVHANFSEKELARSFNTIETLRSTSQMSRFIRWVKDKPVDLRVPVSLSNDRR